MQFWGTRGSIAVSGGAFQRAGGNTSCVEVVHDGHHLILDGGTGLAALGRTMVRPSMRATLVFSHVHWDHIQGVPFFGPAFAADARLRFVGAPGLRDALTRQMTPPLFPIGPEAFQAGIEWWEVDADMSVRSGPFTIWTSELSHPDGVRAYRIEAGGRSVVYATDIEHGDAIDPLLVELSRGADLLIHDAQYTEAEYPGRRGWGHSTWEQAIEVASRAGTDQLALFHHDPGRTDADLAEIEAWAGRRRRGTFAAREGGRVAL